MQTSELNPSSCPQCGTFMDDSFEFCPSCGQKRIQPEESLKDLINNFLGDYFAFDSKIMSSLKPLVGKPGFLTQEFMAHRRVKYISPLRLYIFISILFFLILNWGGVQNDSVDTVSKSGGWDDFVIDYLPKIFFFFVPLFAAIMRLLFRKFKVSYVVQLVGSLHFHAFVFFVLSGYVLVSGLFARLEWYNVNIGLLAVLILWFLVYLFISMKRITQEGGFQVIWKVFLSLVMYTIFVILITIGGMGFFALNN